MKPWILVQSPTASWHHLLGEAQERAHIHLSTDLESYLVFLLMRYTSHPELAASVLGLEYLEGIQLRASPEQLKSVGDKCLLFAGLFPEHAHRRRVDLQYYVQLGQSAFEVLSQERSCPIASLYTHLAAAFPELKLVLSHTRPTTASSSSFRHLHPYTLEQPSGFLSEGIGLNGAPLYKH